MKKTDSTTVYGFEDYKTAYLNEDILFDSGFGVWALSSWSYGKILYPVSDDFDTSFEIEENRKVLAEGKTVYIHPACKISRSLVYNKYKKTNNPWMADIVVIPEYDDCTSRNVPLFINEEEKLLVAFAPYVENYPKYYKFKKGEKLREINSHFDDYPPELRWRDYTMEALKNAEFEGVYKVLYIDTNHEYLIDYLNNSIPKDRIVFEQTIMKSLSCEDNQLTIENASSIYDMLISTDDEIVGSALKALSMMDYMSYPNTVKYMLRNSTYRWKRNKVRNSTSVKAMFNMLEFSWRFRYDDFTNSFISEKDYSLLRQVLEYIHRGCSDEIDYAYSDMRFMYKGNSLEWFPRII
jgi:hypothetical protein